MLTCSRKKKCKVASKHFDTFGHIHNSKKKSCLTRKSKGGSECFLWFPYTYQACLLREGRAAAQPETQQGELKWSNCEARSIFTQSGPGIFNN